MSKVPKIESVSFNQYLNIKHNFLKGAIKSLNKKMKDNKKHSYEYSEAKEMLVFQEEDLKDVNSMLRHDKKFTVLTREKSNV